MERLLKKKNSIYCPKKEDHYSTDDKGVKVSHQKTLLILGDNELYAYCQLHGWLKVELFKGGKKLSFKNVSAVITDMPPTKGKTKYYFDVNELPVVALGAFNRKRRKCLA